MTQFEHDLLEIISQLVVTQQEQNKLLLQIANSLETAEEKSMQAMAEDDFYEITSR